MFHRNRRNTIPHGLINFFEANLHYNRQKNLDQLLKTISNITGRYPGTHGIIANQFFDKSQGVDQTREFFDHLDPRSTGHLRWWQDSENTFEPIWVTAKKQGVKFSAFLWAR